MQHLKVQMDLDRAIGRLLIVGFRGDSLDCRDTRVDIANLKRAHAGGVILFDQSLSTGGARNITSPEQLKELTDNLRNELGEDLIVSIDQEGGRVSRLNPSSGFLESCSAKAFAELSENQQRIYADEHAEQLRELGINLNFTPCVDLAINPELTIIAEKERSFGVDPARVTACARTIIDSHHAQGVRCSIKHFPGHGSAGSDSHEGLVDITDAHQSREIEPFRELIDAYGRSVCVITGHLVHRGRDEHNPASLSSSITTGWLRDELGFDGVVITDSLDMGGATGERSSVRAINAGADVVLNSNNTACGYEHAMATRLHDEIQQGVTPERVFESAQRIADWIR